MKIFTNKGWERELNTIAKCIHGADDIRRLQLHLISVYLDAPEITTETSNDAIYELVRDAKLTYYQRGIDVGISSLLDALVDENLISEEVAKTMEDKLLRRLNVL